MHELAIVQSIIDVVESKAVECRAVRVKDVRLKIGEGSGIVLEALTFCFEALSQESPLLAGAQLSVESVPHRARCHHCDKEFPVVNYVARCPSCGEWSADIVSGTEFQILDMEIETS